MNIQVLFFFLSQSTGLWAEWTVMTQGLHIIKQRPQRQMLFDNQARLASEGHQEPIIGPSPGKGKFDFIQLKSHLDMRCGIYLCVWDSAWAVEVSGPH